MSASYGVRALIYSIAFSALFLATARGADLSGKWNAEYTTPNGQMRQNTFTFQADGDTLTGTVSSQRGESKIENGKISGDEIQFTVTVGEGDRTFEMTAKRAK